MGRGRRSAPFELPERGEVYIVGGAIRDELLGHTPKDYDWALGGLSPEEAEELLGGEPLDVAGQRIGWRVRGEEVALLRRERSTGPAHRDFRIDTQDVSIEEDLRRRDFTCNAIARNVRTGELVDPLGGARDIQAGRLRAISPEAFQEDPLRLLRGAGIMSRFGLRPDPETLRWMKRADPTHLSPERVWGELQKIIAGPYRADAMRMLRDIDQYEALFPELGDTIGFDQESRYHSLSCDEHCFRALENASDTTVRLAAWLHDAGKPQSAWRGPDGRLHYYASGDHPDHAEVGAQIAQQLLRRLRAPRQTQEDVAYLVLHHMWSDTRGNWENHSEDKKNRRARRFVLRHDRYARGLLELRQADASAKGHDASQELRHLQDFRERVLREEAGSWRTLQVDGRDMQELGLQGEDIGRVLRELRRRVCDNPELNQRDRLLRWARSL